MAGYSSYLTLPLDSDRISRSLDAQFHFSTDKVDQIALMFFLGQEGFTAMGSDYLAISYVKGHVLMTWDLGSGE